MLLKLHIRGFKNLEDVIIRFGPLTCFVGPNGVGKSNIFDAIQFLKALADKDIQSAAQSVRSSTSGFFSPKDLLWNAQKNNKMSFEADMLVPAKVEDDFGRSTKPKTPLLKYKIELTYYDNPTPRLEVTSESLQPFMLRDAKAVIGFNHHKKFRQSSIYASRRIGAYISTETDNGDVKIKIHQDGGSRGQAIPAGKSPRTVVGGTNSYEYPTVLAARREMSSWKLLHLEPSTMRAPDPFGGESNVNEHGGHIPATLNKLIINSDDGSKILTEATNRLSELVPELESLDIDRDEARQQISIKTKMKGCNHVLGSRSISDGTLRFLALVTMQLDTDLGGVLCMEEPENGMHPSKISFLIALLKEFIVDPDEAVDENNPARQVVLNTHSPDVVRNLDPEEILFVDIIDGPEGKCARVTSLENSWRKDMPTFYKQKIGDFIGGSEVGYKCEQLKLDLQFGTVR